MVMVVLLSLVDHFLSDLASFLARIEAITSSISSFASSSVFPVPSTPRPPLIIVLASVRLLISKYHKEAPVAIMKTLRTLMVAILSASTASRAPLVCAACSTLCAGASL